MEYEIGKAGRILVMRLSDGDPIYASIENAAQKEHIQSAAVWLVGGIKNAGVVVGPKVQDEFPLQVMEERFSDAREIVGVGTLFTNSKGEPKLHMHAAIGKGDKVVAGCPRKGADCWLVDEVIVMEITGIAGRRVAEAKCGLELLSITPGQRKS
jgi:predicted DNA-binding protein with PD1-like motif